MELLKHFPYKVIRDFQKETLSLLEEQWNKYDVFVIVAPTACHARGQKVIMYDGTLRAVEDVRVGDQLMGPDSKPRIVLELFSGRDKMMRVTPTRGASFDVTHNHILSLQYYKRHGGYNRPAPRYFTHELITQTVSDWNNSSKSHKHCTKLWKPERINFRPSDGELPLPPYFLGTWLGDGSSDTVAVTNMDATILDYWAEIGNEYGLKIRDEKKQDNRAITRHLAVPRGQKNPILNKLRSLGVLDNKHIPHQYLTASYECRLALLAGLVDTDGHVLPGVGTIEIIQKNLKLIQHIVFLARSLGFAVGKIKTKVIKGTPYYRIHMSSQRVNELPLLVPHKRGALLNSKSNQRNDGIKKVEDLGIQEYYGFELDGDHLYLMEDFTVTHNTGKSALAKTLLKAAHSASYIVPTNQLVDQFLATFPDTQTLRRLDSYWCEDSQLPCAKVRAIKKGFCKGCACGTQLAQAKYRRGPGIYTYHAYLAHRLYRDVLIVDEAHQLIPMLQSMGEVVLWQHDYKYPSSAYRPEDILKWAKSLPKKKQEGSKVSLLLQNLQSQVPEYAISRERRDFNGKGTKRGEPEERDCLILTPLSAKEHAGKMWPKDVKKIILLSATINFKDIEALGLGEKKVAYIHSPSPIPADRRPFVVYDRGPVSRANLADATKGMAKYINEVLYPKHRGERGLIHATYQMSAMLRTHLIGPQYLFHDRDNKKEVYQKYLSTRGAVLIACGMFEGIDLPDDAGRWQVLLKVPWPSLGNPAISSLAKRDNEWYIWETAKTLIQAGGRVSRHETDYGITYCLDSTFFRLYDEGRQLMPSWFLDCLVDGNAGT